MVPTASTGNEEQEDESVTMSPTMLGTSNIQETASPTGEIVTNSGGQTGVTREPLAAEETNSPTEGITTDAPTSSPSSSIAGESVDDEPDRGEATPPSFSLSSVPTTLAPTEAPSKPTIINELPGDDTDGDIATDEEGNEGDEAYDAPGGSITAPGRDKDIGAGGLAILPNPDGLTAPTTKPPKLVDEISNLDEVPEASTTRSSGAGSVWSVSYATVVVGSAVAWILL